MTRAYEVDGRWRAEYRDRLGYWRVAHDARHLPLACTTEALALSVARYRRRRLKVLA